MKKWAPEKIASLTYVLPIAAVGGIWYILLFMYNGPNPNYGEMLHAWLIELPERGLFWWLVILPALCLALSIAYLSPVPRRKSGAIALAVIGASVAVAAWWVFDAAIAIFVTIPLIITIPRAWHLTTRSSLP
jgi:hypothetical protein